MFRLPPTRLLALLLLGVGSWLAYLLLVPQPASPLTPSFATIPSLAESQEKPPAPAIAVGATSPTSLPPSSPSIPQPAAPLPASVGSSSVAEDPNSVPRPLGEEAPIDLSRNYVLIGSQRAHPNRILAKFSPAARASAVRRGLDAQQFEAFTSPLSTTGLLQLRSTARFPTEVRNVDEARQRGDALQERIRALMATGQFEYVEPDYIVSLRAAPTDQSFVNGTLWALRNTGQSGGVAAG